MAILDQNEDNAGGTIIPPGFTVVPSGGNGFIIHHTRSGMGCLNHFLIVWLAAWSLGCVFLLFQYFNGGKMEDGSPIPLWFVGIFWAVEVIVARFLASLLFGRKSFQTDATHLNVDTVLFGFRRTKAIPRSTIKRFVQVKDGGEDDDSFPSWGLQVEAEKKTTLLFRQPFEMSQWLGRVLAQWAEVELVESSRK